MRQKIRIGYIGQNNSWEQLLGQIGVHWNRVNPHITIPVEEQSCLIVDRDLTQSERTNVDRYLKEDGAILDATGQFVSGSLHKKTFSIVFPEDGDSGFGHIEQIPVYGSCRTVSSSGILNGLVWFDPSPNRNITFLGLPVHRLWNDVKTVHRQFGSDETAVTAERTSALQSHPYFQVILTLLRKLHSDRKLPLVHTWWHPDPNKQVATFRVDSDYGSLNSIQQISGISNRNNFPITWFLHVEHHEDWMESLINSISEKDEISLHCYRHSEYKTTAQIRSDIIRGLEILKRNNVSPSGYAAPYGYWSKELADALKSFPFDYTSEFGYDHDSLPSVASDSGTLQLPVHPVSIGSFSRFGATPVQINSYYEELIRFRRLQQNPVHL
ncbi:MAG: polysaccharide deacetylase family protein, partial [Bacteroidales bacterium]|nr:polysaccharide deacetylase family protein [Bacteroidales bacterium]